MRWLTEFGPLVCVCVLIGCAQGSAPNASLQQASPDKRAHGVADEARAENALALGANQVAGPDKLAKKEKDDGKPQNDFALPNGAIERKLIATGRIEITVEKFDTAVRDLKELVKLDNGYVANSDDSGSSGGPRVGTYTIRVPAKEFAKFVDDVAMFGEVRHRTSDTQDITDQYYDTATHLKNDEVHLEGLRKLYDTAAQKDRLDNMQSIYREMSSITGQIEEQKGRLNRWDKLVAYSTVVVQVSQRTEYEAAGTPSFGTTITRTWGGSLNALAEFGKALLLIAVAVAPWLGVLAVVTAPLWIFLWLRVRKSRSARRPTPTPPAPPQTEPPVAALPA